MDNFVAKIEEGNYVISYEKSFKATAYSEDLVYYNFNLRTGGITYDGFAVMTVNGNESFMGLLGKDGVDQITFIREGKALDLANSPKAFGEFNSLLLNYLIKASDGNMWNLFYNSTEDPLTFTSKDDKEVGDNLLVFGLNYQEGSTLINIDFRVMENDLD